MRETRASRSLRLLLNINKLRLQRAKTGTPCETLPGLERKLKELDEIHGYDRAASQYDRENWSKKNRDYWARRSERA